ncbi:hypothetical protein SDC9_212475 [bioreactor metagenome]|uniref:Uncharacterized protein n=1 Tax=bioreactor metagenome TaxID=1076179 RepID=A0A645JPN4_9ZZZZ
MLRKILLESVQLIGVNQCSRRIIGVTKVDRFCLWSNGGQYFVKIRNQGVLVHGNFHQLATAALNVVIIAGVGRRRKDDLIPRLDKHLGDEAQTRCSALGHHDFIRGQAVFFGELLAQRLRAHVRIAV